MFRTKTEMTKFFNAWQGSKRFRKEGMPIKSGNINIPILGANKLRNSHLCKCAAGHSITNVSKWWDMCSSLSLFHQTKTLEWCKLCVSWNHKIYCNRRMQPFNNTPSKVPQYTHSCFCFELNSYHSVDLGVFLPVPISQKSDECNLLQHLIP